MPHCIKIIPLCEFLLTHKADPNDQAAGEPPFFLAKKVALAELFIQYGANLLLQGRRFPQNSVFHKIMQPDYEPDLIRLYKQKGASPFIINANEVNAAHALAGSASAFAFIPGPRHPDTMLEKAKILLDDLDPKQAKKLLTARTCANCTPMDYIANEPQFKALYVYLKNKASSE